MLLVSENQTASIKFVMKLGGFSQILLRYSLQINMSCIFLIHSRLHTAVIRV